MRTMRTGIAAVAAILVVVAGACLRDGGPRVVSVSAGADGSSDLQAVLDGLEGPARVELAPGTYRLSPVDHEEPTCANCPDPAMAVRATRGLRVTGRGIHLTGGDPEAVVIETNAGYGILFQDCEDCALEGLTVTGGVRDRDANASDAAVVVQRSTVRVEGCVLRDNVGEAQVVRVATVGIMGLTVREGGDAIVSGCRILRNSWDGIALYRGARATITGNVIDGVDLARGRQIGGGRGVGIGVTWDAEAVIEGNLVRRYWKGVGVFVNGRAEIRHNVVEDVATWGIAIWEASGGTPWAVVEENAVAVTGACGIVVTQSHPAAVRGAGSLVGNAVLLTGRDEAYDAPDRYCRQAAIDLDAVPEGYRVEGNLLHANREAGGRPGEGDLDLDTFRTRVAPLVRELGAEPGLAEARFLRDWS